MSLFCSNYLFRLQQLSGKNRLKNDKLELTNKIEQLQQTIARNNQIIADNEQLKREFIETCNQDKKAIGLIKIIDFYIV